MTESAARDEAATDSDDEAATDSDEERLQEAEPVDSDEELQEAFAAGLIAPGLTRVFEKKERVHINNVAGLNQKLEEFELKLPWMERLDLVNGPAKLAPELAFKEQQHEKQREKLFKNNQKAKLTSLADDPVHNDFKREMLFYRQAQQAVLEAIPRLHSLGVATRRPDDYFAQMAKSDDHMNKVRKKLLEKQSETERIEKIRKLRELKKFGKQVQVKVQQDRQKEKRDMLEQVKKFRKGQTDSIDFLDGLSSGGGGKKSGQSVDKKSKASQAVRKQKDKKFGFGGKKRDSKRNTAESSNDVSGFKRGKKNGAAQKFNNKPGFSSGFKSSGAGKKGGGVGKQKRPGKGTRQKMRNKNKSRK